MTPITPFLIGSGASGQALSRALLLAHAKHPDLTVAPIVKLARGQSLEVVAAAARPLLLVANPHGLHAAVLGEASRRGIADIIAEKPACVTLEQAESLAAIPSPVAICHGYRQMWGPRRLAELHRGGELGRLIAIEGRYWQSSAAARAVTGERKDSWKNDPAINGPFDTLVDLGAHWADLAVFCAGGLPAEARVWLTRAGGEAAHRDTHVHLTMRWAQGAHAIASISKIWHGAGNHLELHLVGTRGRASWSFASPDSVEIARGGELTRVPRGAGDGSASGQAPFHGLGWLEGYLSIVENTLLRMAGRPAGPVPTLAEHLGVMRVLLAAGGAAQID